MSNSISGNAGVAAAYVTAISADLATTVVNATADGSGNYTLSGLSAGTYFVSASLTGYLFGPAPGYQVITITSSNVTGVNFTGALFTSPVPGAWTKQGTLFTANTHVGGLFPGTQPTSILYEGNSQLGLGAGNVFKLYYSDGNNCEYAESLTGLPGSWTKYSSNPIIANMFYPNVYESGGTYYLNCIDASSYPITAVSIYTASTSVGPWTLKNSNALTPPSWAASSIGGIVVLDIIGGTWYALFTAQGGSPVFATAIGLCTSPDGGISGWTVVGSAPVIYNASSPGIRKIGSTYYVWFNYNNYDEALATGSSSGYVLYATVTTVYRAQSTNFTTWTNFVPTMFRTTLEEGEGLGKASSTGAPQFAEANGESFMFYVANPTFAGPNLCSVATTPQTMASLIRGNEGTVYAGQLAYDNFVRASYPENPLSGGGVWSTLTGFSALEVPSLGLCQASTESGVCWSIYTGISWPANQYSEIVLAADAPVDGFYIVVRNAPANAYGYLFNIQGSLGSSITATLYAGTSAGTNALTTFTLTPYAGDTIRLSVETVGSSNVLSVYQNTILIGTFTDSVYASSLTSGIPGVALNVTQGSLSDAQFSAWAGGTPVYTITGNVGVAGATVSYSGPSSGSVTSGVGGSYIISGLVNGSYTITVSYPGKTFTPSSQLVTINSANQTGINFTVSGSSAEPEFGTTLDTFASATIRSHATGVMGSNIGTRMTR